MAAWPVVTPRLVLVCSLNDTRRRHQRKRNWDGKRQQQDHQESESESERVTINLDNLGERARDGVHRVSKLAISLADEWRSTVRLNRERGLVISLNNRSPLEYVGLASACLLLFALLAKCVETVSKAYSRPEMIVKRDRSLGGKEVVVGTARQQQQKPLMPLDGLGGVAPARSANKRVNRRQQRRLPQWWTSMEISPSITVDSYAQAQVEALMRVIVDKRLSGKDFMEEDVVLLRRMCRSSGAKADFGTENTRDSFFRGAVAFVLTACASNIGLPTSKVEYGGENMVGFVCGLAANINLDAMRAASIVNAAVAARTRAGFLQAWANLAQGKSIEADEEMRQLACMHLVFPPEPNSPHMEMVGRSLESHLAFHERSQLLEIYTKYSTDTAPALEALALSSIIS